MRQSWIRRVVPDSTECCLKDRQFGLSNQRIPQSVSARDQMMVVDIHLFVADQMRFEMMRRLEWIRTFEGGKYSLLDMVQEFEKVKTRCRKHPPVLAESNPDYTTYAQLTIGDKEVFIRRMLQEALDAFKERL